MSIVRVFSVTDITSTGEFRKDVFLYHKPANPKAAFFEQQNHHLLRRSKNSEIIPAICKREAGRIVVEPGAGGVGEEVVGCRIKQRAIGVDVYRSRLSGDDA